MANTLAFNPITGKLDVVFNPLAPWPGNIDLNCNVINNHGGINTGCAGDWEFHKTSAGNLITTIQIGNYHRYISEGGLFAGKIDLIPGDASNKNMIRFVAVSNQNRHNIQIPTGHDLVLQTDSGSSNWIGIDINEGFTRSSFRTVGSGMGFLVPAGYDVQWWNSSGSTDFVRLLTGTIGTPSVFASVSSDLQLEVDTAGKMIIFEGLVSDTSSVTYDGPSYEAINLSPTITGFGLVGNPDSALVRSAGSHTHTAGGGSAFATGAGGLNFTHTLNSGGSSSDFGSTAYGAAFVSYFNGGVRTCGTVTGMHCQSGTFVSGTATNVWAVNGQALAVIGGLVTSGMSIRSLQPTNFFGGSISSSYGYHLSGTTTATTKYGFFQTNVYDNRFRGNTSIGHTTAPNFPLDVQSPIRIRTVGSFATLYFGGTTGTAQAQWSYDTGGQFFIQTLNQTYNNSITFETELDAESVGLLSTTANLFRLNFDHLSFGSSIHGATAPNYYAEFKTPSGLAAGAAGDWTEISVTQTGAVDLVSLAMTNVSAVSIDALAFTHTAASVSNYASLLITGAPTGGPAPSGDRYGLLVQGGTDNNRIDGDLEVGRDLIVEETVNVGDQGTEAGGINWGGTTYDTVTKISEIGGSLEAMLSLHRHSTTLPVGLISSRSNTDDDTHSAVTNGQSLWRQIHTGWTGSHYDVFAEIRAEVSGTGTVSATSSPGKLRLMTTPDGSNTLADAIVLDEAQATTIVGDVGFYNTAPGAKPTVTGSRGGNTALASLLTSLAGLGLITDSTSA